MDNNQRRWGETVATKIIKNLEKRRMAGSYAPTAAQARDEILSMIPKGAIVYRCGSMTAANMGLVAPVNAARIGVDTPCVKTGLCVDCRSPQRICNMWSIIEGHMIKDRIHVILVGENLGY